MSEQFNGKVKYINPSKGFGFITPDVKGKPDVFFSLDQLRGNAARMPQKGESVIYEEGTGKRGPIALNVFNMADSLAVEEYLADLEVTRQFQERKRKNMLDQMAFTAQLIEKNKQWRERAAKKTAAGS